MILLNIVILEGVKGKGALPAYIQKVVEQIAKEKGLV
jgi:hypothetical protein